MTILAGNLLMFPGERKSGLAVIELAVTVQAIMTGSTIIPRQRDVVRHRIGFHLPVAIAAGLG